MIALWLLLRHQQSSLISSFANEQVPHQQKTSSGFLHILHTTLSTAPPYKLSTSSSNQWLKTIHCPFTFKHKKNMDPIFVLLLFSALILFFLWYLSFIYFLFSHPNLINKIMHLSMYLFILFYGRLAVVYICWTLHQGSSWMDDLKERISIWQ